MNDFAKKEHTTVRRLAKRAAYDRETVYKVLDEGLICHAGFIVDERPFVVPTIHARDGDRLIFHGSVASRLMRTLAAGVEVCITVTLLDGLVLARSTFHHSMNYRSVMVFGRAFEITDPEDKRRALGAMVEHIVKGRSAEARRPSDGELKATSVLELPLEEASAKVRVGPPLDDEEDYAMNIWAGVLPLKLTPGEPVPDPRLDPSIVVPDYVRSWKR